MYQSKVKIKKLKSVDNPYHKNSDFGESKEFHIGYYMGDPIIGERFNVGYINYLEEGINTSPVMKIIDKKTFETLNSVYEWEIIE
jgi:hypothetical protein